MRTRRGAANNRRLPAVAAPAVSPPLTLVTDVGGLDLLSRDLATQVSASAVLIATRDPRSRRVDPLAGWGLRALPDPAGPTLGFLESALTAQSLLMENYDPARDASFGPRAAGRPITFAIGVPVLPPAGPETVLCGCFAEAPVAMAEVLWVMQAYAGLAARRLHQSSTDVADSSNGGVGGAGGGEIPSVEATG